MKASPQPPHWAERLLEWLAAPHLLEEVQGDLRELFHQRLQKVGPGKARLWYVLDLLRLIHPRLWRRKPSQYPSPNPIRMFRHNLLLSFRTFKRFKSSFFINLIGLSTGLAGTLLIYLWVSDELRVGKFHQQDSQLFQVMENWHTAEGIQTSEPTPGLLAKALAEEMPEIDYAVATIRPGGLTSEKGIFSVGENHGEAIDLCVGKDFFNVFSYPLIQGDKDQVLADKNAVLLSDEMAMKLFHTTENVIGKSVEWNQSGLSGLYKVSGIFQKPPANALEHFDALFNYALFLEKNPKLADWGNGDPSTYVVVKKGTNLEQFNEKLAGFIKSKKNDSKVTLFLQKYSDKYLYNHYENGVPTGGRIEYVRLFSVIGLVILLIACINFMNLSTAKASGRLKEVGIKKVVGARRNTLIAQYLGESLLMTFLSVMIAILLVSLLLPQFNEMTGKQLTLNVDAHLVLSILGITLFTGLLSGSYPALYLSGFKPMTVLKGGSAFGKRHASVGELWVRKGLVVFQFTLSVIFIVSVWVVYQQMQLIQTKNLGYNRDHILYFEKGGRVSDNKEDYQAGGKYEQELERLLQQVKNIPGVINAANFRHNITNRHGGTSDLSWEGKSPDARIDFTDIAAGYDFIETLGIEMAAGRTFSRDYGSERSKIIFNEAAIESMGLKNPIGKVVHLWGEDRQIIGVAKNFHFESLYENLKPCFFDFTFNHRASKIMVKIKAGTERETMHQLEKLYQEYNQGLAFDYHFLDEDYQALYAAENRVAILSRYFAGFAILISCLGLFGLAAFTAERRRKEMGIRKVLGLSEVGIVYLLSSDFTKLVLVAILIALPVSHLIVKHWLEGFAYRITLQLWYFAGAGLLALIIAWLTVGLQAIKAARMNPVRSLREE